MLRRVVRHGGPAVSRKLVPQISRPTQKYSSVPPTSSDIDHSYALNIPLSRALAKSLKPMLPRVALPPPPIDGLYRRPLPEHLIAFSSPEGKKLFREALSQGYMEGYFSLAEQFHTQQDPASTLSMCLNALKIDPLRIWKGPWRWFVDDMLDCCTPIEVVKSRGISFAEFGCLAKCNGAEIRSFRADHSTEQHFRESIKHATSVEHLHLVCSYARETLGQTGIGHFSPVGGYHVEQDLVLVLDVARFKYDPHWVPVKTLWDAMEVMDEATNMPRGYYLLSTPTQSHTLYPLLLARLNRAAADAWLPIDKFLTSMFPAAIASTKPTAIAGACLVFAQSMPRNLGLLDLSVPEVGSKLTEAYNIWKRNTLAELQQTEIHRIIRGLQSDASLPSGISADGLALIMLALPAHTFASMEPSVQEQLLHLRILDHLPQQLRGEVIRLREAIILLSHKCKRKARLQP